MAFAKVFGAGDNVGCLLLKDNFSPRWRQAYVALGPTLLTISAGMVEGFSAIFLPQLQNENKWNLNPDVESWIASIATLPMGGACLLGGYAMEIIGRKYIHQLNCILNLVGWIILYFAWNTSTVLIGRFITGFTVGLIGPSSPAYLAETSDPNFRGVSLAMLAFAVTFGIGFSHILGTLFYWRHIALISCIFPITAFISMIFAPESPMFLIKKSNVDDGTKAFFWCRGNDPISMKELQTVIDKQKTIQKTKGINFRPYFQSEFVKPLLIILVFFFILQWSGSNALTFYTVNILELSLGGKIDAYLSMIIMDIIRLIFSVIALYLQKSCRRRPHMIFTTMGVLVSLIVLSATLFASKFNNVIIEKYNFILLIAFCTYMAFLSLGLNPLPWTMMGEVFPLSSKGVGSGIAACINFAFIFSVVKTTPFLFENIGVDGAFLLYAVATLFGLIILVIFLPETKDKPLHEIEDGFK